MCQERYVEGMVNSAVALVPMHSLVVVLIFIREVLLHSRKC